MDSLPLPRRASSSGRKAMTRSRCRQVSEDRARFWAIESACSLKADPSRGTRMFANIPGYLLDKTDGTISLRSARNATLRFLAVLRGMVDDLRLFAKSFRPVAQGGPLSQAGVPVCSSDAIAP